MKRAEWTNIDDEMVALDVEDCRYQEVKRSLCRAMAHGVRAVNGCSEYGITVENTWGDTDLSTVSWEKYASLVESGLEPCPGKCLQCDYAWISPMPSACPACGCRS